MRRTQIFMNKFVYLGLSISDLSKTVKYEFLYDYAKPKYGKKAKLCYMDTDSFIVYIKTGDIYADIIKEFNLNYKFDKPLPKGKKLKVIGLMKE